MTLFHFLKMTPMTCIVRQMIVLIFLRITCWLIAYRVLGTTLSAISKMNTVSVH